MDKLIEFRTDHKNVTRQVAKEYFRDLSECLRQLTPAELKTGHIRKKGEKPSIYTVLRPWMDYMMDKYSLDKPENKHFRIKDFSIPGRLYELGTFFERLPAIKSQIEELAKMPSEVEVLIDQTNAMSYKTKIAEVKSFLANIDNYSPLYHLHNPFDFEEYIDLPGFEKVLTQTSFKDGWENQPKLKKSPWRIAEQFLAIRTLDGKTIFPSEGFIKCVREIVQWYGKCNQIGFDASQVIVQKDARKTYDTSNSREDYPLSDLLQH